MITVLLIVHGLLAVVLLGAVSHQALSVGRRPAQRRSFAEKFRAVAPASYSKAIILLFIITCIGGALLYPTYRLDVRPTLEDRDLRTINGVFEIKEHFAAIGLGLLPAYWFFWKNPAAPETATTRRYLTWMLAGIVWWNFLVGHVLNNVRGVFE